MNEIIVVFLVLTVLFIAVRVVIWQFRRIEHRFLGYRPKSFNGYVYCWRDSEDRRYCKIGRTKNLSGRFSAFKTAQPKPIKVIAVLPVADDREAEAYLHTLHKQSRVSKSNEWFRYTPRIWLYFQIIKDREMTKRVQSLM